MPNNDHTSLEKPTTIIDFAVKVLGLLMAIRKNTSLSSHSVSTIKTLFENASLTLRIFCCAPEKTFWQCYNQFLAPKKSMSVMYEFLSSNAVCWPYVSLQMAACFILHIVRPSTWQESMFIVDDSLIKRERSKEVDLLSKQYSHTDGRYHRGFNMLSVGIYIPIIGKFVPLMFQLLSSPNKDNRRGVKGSYDKRTKYGKYLSRAIQSKFAVLMQMLKDIRDAGIPVNHILMDSWFAQPIYLLKLHEAGYYVTCMLKSNTTKYIDARTGCIITLKEELAKLKKQFASGHLSSSVCMRQVLIIHKGFEPIKANICFCRNTQDETKANRPFVALLSNDLDLNADQIRQAYTKRWQIEVQYKNLKSKLGLESGSQCRKISSIVSLVSFCHIRYLIVVFAQTYLFKDAPFSVVVDKLAKEDEMFQQTYDSIELMLPFIKPEQVVEASTHNAGEQAKTNGRILQRKERTPVIFLQTVFLNCELRNKLLAGISNVNNANSCLCCNLLRFGTVYSEVTEAISTYAVLRCRWAKHQAVA